MPRCDPALSTCATPSGDSALASAVDWASDAWRSVDRAATPMVASLLGGGGAAWLCAAGGPGALLSCEAFAALGAASGWLIGDDIVQLQDGTPARQLNTPLRDMVIAGISVGTGSLMA